MNKRPLTRRAFLERAALLGAVASVGGVAVASCTGGGGGFTCDDVSGLSEADAATRTSLAYVDASPEAEKNCLNCQLYTGGEAECGACTVVKGPIHPQGYCTAWAAKA